LLQFIDHVVGDEINVKLAMKDLLRDFVKFEGAKDIGYRAACKGSMGCLREVCLSVFY
jgi:hypothetical protein